MGLTIDLLVATLETVSWTELSDRQIIYCKERCDRCMPSISRRRLLAATASVPPVLAGCARPGSSEESIDNVSVSEEPMPTDAFDVITLRSNDADQLVYAGDEQPSDDGDGDGENQPRQYGHGRSAEFVLTTEDATALRIDADETTAIRSFLDATEFDTESVVVEQRTIEDCQRRHLLSVRAEPDRFRTEYCRRLKPAMTPCTADRTVTKAVFIRIQRAYDDPPSSRSSGERTTCPDSVFEESTTEDSDE